MKEEALVLKAEDVTSMARNNRKTKAKILKLCHICEDNEIAHIIFSVFRARLSDGIRNGHHLSTIKTLWLMDTLAKHGHHNMVEFIAAALPYLQGVAQYYATHSDTVDTEAFYPVMQKACELADFLQSREAAESPRRAEETKIDEAVDKYLESVENVLSDIQTKLIQKVHRDGRASDAELVSPPDTPRTPTMNTGYTLNDTFGTPGSTPGLTPTNSFTSLLRPTRS
ncbi:hypothetical protein HOP50_12g67800 [Chloropicon primus]|uniref:Uncharacterized protein n=1 Tax=Chloropicon primus TaxID=1764295 RepID=A0A5B8MXP8_9CHLO|nr:hypothetical protein A3770_12p67620 [Chloropicon primus]UPR03451.1 hypothetical protein HOP50_12g67800 [Chloropicon primus]|eukprot:QDZ24244.1 hypothetical protein A3770_12p67620 [Chloropicon primus]